MHLDYANKHVWGTVSNMDVFENVVVCKFESTSSV